MDYTYERTINYYETDKMGVVHHSNYIRFFEEARCQFLKDANKVTASITEHGPEYTGALPGDKIKNIYDLGNNLREWTAEAVYTNDRVRRGR